MATFCGSGCAGKAQRQVSELSGGEQKAFEANLEAARTASAHGAARKAWPLSAPREQQLDLKVPVVKPAASTSESKGDLENAENWVRGHCYTKEQWAEIRAGWWGWALGGVLLNGLTLGIYAAVLFTIWQSSDEERSLGKRIAIGTGMSLLLFVPFAWVGVAPWSRDFYFFWREDQAELAEPRAAERTEQRRIADLEAEVTQLSRAKRIAELEAEVARLRAEQRSA